MPETKETSESEALEHDGGDMDVKGFHDRLEGIEKHLGIGKHAPKKKTDMERLKERRRHT